MMTSRCRQRWEEIERERRKEGGGGDGVGMKVKVYIKEEVEEDRSIKKEKERKRRRCSFTFPCSGKIFTLFSFFGGETHGSMWARRGTAGLYYLQFWPAEHQEKSKIILLPCTGSISPRHFSFSFSFLCCCSPSSSALVCRPEPQRRINHAAFVLNPPG